MWHSKFLKSKPSRAASVAKNWIKVLTTTFSQNIIILNKKALLGQKNDKVWSSFPFATPSQNKLVSSGK